MTGVLIYDDVIERFVVEPLTGGGDSGWAVIDPAATTVELHCGDCLSIQMKDGGWQETRIESNEDGWYGWYFVRLGKAAQFIGHNVRMEVS